MTHEGWLISLPCMLVADALFALFIIIAYQSTNESDRNTSAILITTIACGLFNLAFLSTLFLNPGIVAEHHCE